MRAQALLIPRLSSPAFSSVSFLSSHLLVPPASFQLPHVSHSSIFSLVVLSYSFYLLVPASFLFRYEDQIVNLYNSVYSVTLHERTAQVNITGLINLLIDAWSVG